MPAGGDVALMLASNGDVTYNGTRITPCSELPSERRGTTEHRREYTLSFRIADHGRWPRNDVTFEPDMAVS